MRVRIECDVTTGLLPTSTDAAALAGLVMTVTQGLSVLARDGSSRSSLLAIVNTAMQAWPQASADG